MKLLQRALLLLFALVFLNPFLSGQAFLDSLQANFEFRRGALADESYRAQDAVGFHITSDVGLEGSINGAYQFDGVTSYMHAGTDNRNVTNQLTISAWFKTTSADRQIIVSKYNVNADRGYVLGIIDGEASIEGRDGSNIFHRITSEGIPVNDGQWHFATGVINGNSWQLYLDCELVNEMTTNSVAPQFSGVEPLTIGRLSSMTNDNEFHHFKGSIDNVKLFNIPLTSGQVQQLSPFGCMSCGIDLDDGLVAYYPLDGNGLDHAQNELHGTVGGAVATTNQQGYANSAMHFDGVDDYILVANAEPLNFGTGNFAVSLWVKSDAPDEGPQMVIQKGQSGNLKVNPYYWVRLNEFGDELTLQAALSDGYPPFTDLKSTDPFFADQEWHHIVYQRTNTQIELWVDNQLIAFKADSQFRDVSGNGNLIIGAQNPWDDGGNFPFIHNYFQGSIDEVRLYNKALCMEEVEALSGLISGTTTIPSEVGKISLYPNPSSEMVQIDLRFHEMTEVKLQLFDLQGRELWQQEWFGQEENLPKDINNLPAGVYILRAYLPEFGVFQSLQLVKE